MKKDGEESNQDIERYVELNEMELVQRVQKYLLKRRLLGVLGETECEVVEMWSKDDRRICEDCRDEIFKEPLAVGSRMMCLTYRQPRRWLYAYGRYSKSSGGCKVV
jgi:hypothetical protein